MSDVDVLKQLVIKHQELKKEIGKVIIGQNEAVDQMVFNLLNL